eukprot:CCRYP_005343-RA/>CCRYP_005343-RA protein AED:0.43 eAED:0.43 QI:0/0/0/1/0/0/2/0/68
MCSAYGCATHTLTKTTHAGQPSNMTCNNDMEWEFSTPNLTCNFMDLMLTIKDSKTTSTLHEKPQNLYL